MGDNLSLDRSVYLTEGGPMGLRGRQEEGVAAIVGPIHPVCNWKYDLQRDRIALAGSRRT